LFHNTTVLYSSANNAPAAVRASMAMMERSIEEPHESLMETKLLRLSRLAPSTDEERGDN
jgi:hypothetical protein